MAPKRPFERDALTSPVTPVRKRRCVTFSSPGPSESYPQPVTPETPGRRSRTPASFTTPSSRASSSTPYSVPADSPSNPFGPACAAQVRLPNPTSFSRHLCLRFQVVLDTGGAGPYRIVQVPKNYTFRHLHLLILFLFSAPPVNQPPRRGHIFEVLKRAEAHGNPFRPGRVRKGHICAKLSNLWDDYQQRRAAGEKVVSDEPVEDEDEGDEWRWEGEDDFTVGNAWPKDPDPARAIIYRHNPHGRPSVDVHITINDIPVQGRRGVGCTPYVFTGSRLAFSLDAPHAPSASIREPTDPVALRLEVRRWNKHDAFMSFIRAAAPGIDVDEEGDEDEDDEEEGAVWSCSSSDVHDLPLVTPAPTRALHRLRVDLTSRRIRRLSHAGLPEMIAGLEEPEEEEKPTQVDQLAHDDNDDPNDPLL